MDDYKKLLEKEVDSFKIDLKKKKHINFEKLTKDEFAKCFRLAFHDAFGQYCRREKKHYKEGLERFLDNDFPKFYEAIIAKFKKEYEKLKLSSPSEPFDSIVDYLKVPIKNIVKSNIKKENDEDISYGLLQKVTSMTLKYLYCFDDVKKDYLKDCYMPLDSYTILWYKKCNIDDLDKKIKNDHKTCCESITNWTNLSEGIFKNIQQNISEILQANYKYIRQFNNNFLIPLSPYRLEAEFVIWKYEQLKKQFDEITRALKYTKIISTNK